MKYLLGFLAFFCLTISPVFAVQTGGAGAANPVVITGAITVEGYSKSPTLEITSGVTKLGAPTYTWPSALGDANSFLKDSGSGALAWVPISGTVPDPTAAGSLLIGTANEGSWQSQPVSGDVSITSTGVATVIGLATFETTAAMNAVLSTFETASNAASTYSTLAQLSTFETTAHAASTYSTLAQLSTFETTAHAASTYSTLAQLSTFETAAHAASTYAPTSALSTFETTAAMNAVLSTFETTASLIARDYAASSALGTFETAAHAASTYAPTSALSTFETTASLIARDYAASSALGTFETTAHAASTYAPLALTSGSIFVGNGSNVAAAQTVGGDLTITNTGVTTIGAGAITGPELADQVVKSGTLNDAAYSITLSNEGTGDSTMVPAFPIPLSSVVKMQNSGGSLLIGQVASQYPGIGGAGAIYNGKFLVLASPVVKTTGLDLQLAIDTEAGNIRFLNTIDTEIDDIELLTINQTGVITAYSLPPSLYVKTTAGQALTAEAFSVADLPLDEGKILIGDGSNQAAANTVSGDITITSTGVTTIAANAVTTTEIASGAVTTVKIADASVTAAKLASDFIMPVTSGGTSVGSFAATGLVYASSTTSLTANSQLTWDDSYKTLLIGGQTPAFMDEGPDPGLMLLGNAVTNIGAFTAGAGEEPAFFLGNSRGTLSSPTASQTDDGLGTIMFVGYDGTGIAPAAGIFASATQNWGGGANGTSLSLMTVNDDKSFNPNDSTTVTGLIISNGSISAFGNLGVTGRATVTSTFEAMGRVNYTPSDTQTITAAGGVTESMIDKKVILIAGDGAGTTDITPGQQQIFAGSNGQMIILIGTNDSNLVKFDNGDGLQLSAATSFTMGIGDIMQLVYVDAISGGTWVEISRTDN